MTDISEKEKTIYNNHLVATRKAKGEPFRIRRDFSKLEAEKLEILQRLSKFFDEYPHINQEDFFMAPYETYDDDYHALDYYTTGKAVSCYSRYMKKLDMDNPDSDQSISRLKEGLKFIFRFCKERGLTFSDYMVYSEESLPCFVDHLKKHKINFYTLHALTFSTPKIESKILEFVIPDFFLTF